MKKLLSILLAMVLLCGTCLLTACGGNGGDANNDDGKKDEPVDLYTVVKNATEQTLAATSYEAKSVFVLDTEMFGTKMKTTADLVFKCNGNQVGAEGKSILEMADSKTETPLKFYYDGEFLYMTMLGEGYKIAATEEDFAEEVGNSSVYIVVLPEKLFEGVTGTADNVVLTVDDATLKDLYGEAIGDVIGEDIDDLSQLTVKDGKITISVKDGYLATFNVAYTCEIVVEEETVTYVCSQETTFTQYGDVTVTPMEGYEDFEEMDDDFLFGEDDLIWEDDDLTWDDDDLFNEDDFLFDEDELLFDEDEL